MASKNSRTGPGRGQSLPGGVCPRHGDYMDPGQPSKDRATDKIVCSQEPYCPEIDPGTGNDVRREK